MKNVLVLLVLNLHMLDLTKKYYFRREKNNTEYKFQQLALQLHLIKHQRNRKIDSPVTAFSKVFGKKRLNLLV